MTGRGSTSRCQRAALLSSFSAAPDDGLLVPLDERAHLLEGGHDMRREAGAERDHAQGGLHRRPADRRLGRAARCRQHVDIRISQLSALVGRGMSKTVTLIL